MYFAKKYKHSGFACHDLLVEKKLMETCGQTSQNTGP